VSFKSSVRMSEWFLHLVEVLPEEMHPALHANEATIIKALDACWNEGWARGYDTGFEESGRPRYY